MEIKELQHKVARFMDEREWGPFHSPKNVSMAIATEAAELMEIFRWMSEEQSWQALHGEYRKDIEYEIADVAIAVLNFCNRADIDLSKAIDEKLTLAAKKYPVEKAKGNIRKYTEL